MDGVLVLRCPTDISRLCPSLSDGAAQRWLWAAGIASDSSIVDFLTLDVKRVGLIGSALKDRDFSYSAMLCLRSKTPAELYIVYFEGIEDYFALIPRVVVTRCSDVAGGILPLMTGFPAFYVPFMVHVTRLAAAVELLTMSILNPDTAVYTNPETGTHMHGLRLAVSQMPPICPVTSERDLELRNRSFAAIKSFWQTLKHVSDVKVSFNAYAPLIADFLLTFELTGLEIRIEHKCFCGPAPGPDYNSSSESLTTLTTRFFRNPFAFARQWHFLVIQIPGARPDDDVFLCIARNEVPDEWASLESLKVRHAVYQQTKRRYFGTNDGVRAMLDWMRLAGPKAIHHAQQLLNAPVEQAYDYGAIDDLSSEEDEPSIADGSSEPADNFDGPHRQWRAPAQRRQYTETLTFWSAQFNDFCCERGSLVCLPLDPGHPWQVNHVVVDHRWTQAEQYDYAVSRQLPLALYQHAVADNKAVALRIADISTSDVPYPVYLRGSQWMKAFPDSPKYFLVGGNLDPKTLEAAIIPPSYVFFPMGFTKQFDPRNAREPPLITSGPHYFRKELQEFGRIPEPKFTDVRAGTKRLSKNDAFMSQPDVNPARYMLDLPEIHKFVGQCLHGTETGLISVNTQQDCRKNQTFDYTEYMRTVRDFNQATWTFGCMFYDLGYHADTD